MGMVIIVACGWSWVQYLKDEDRGGREADGGVGGHDDDALPEPPLVLVLVPVTVLTEGRTRSEPPPSALNYQDVRMILLKPIFFVYPSGKNLGHTKLGRQKSPKYNLNYPWKYMQFCSRSHIAKCSQYAYNSHINAKKYVSHMYSFNILN